MQTSDKESRLLVALEWLKKHRLLFLIVFLLVLPSMIYLNENTVQSYVEYFLPNSSGIKALFYAWHPTNFGTNNSTSLWRIFPLTGYYQFFSSVVHLPSNAAQELLLSIFRISGFFGFIALVKALFGDYKFSKKALYIAGLLFVYNLYTLNYFASSYIVLLPYYLMPLEIFLFIKAMRASDSYKTLLFVVLAALTNSAFFGVNLVFDVISFAALFFVSIFFLLQRQVSFKKIIAIFITLAVTTLSLTIWWLMPMLTASTSDQETSSFILGSEDFYNLETSPINLMRGLGEWGFFSGYRGEPYHNFSSWYRNPLAVLSSLILISLFLYALSNASAERSKRVKYLLTYISLGIIVLLPFIGGTNPGWYTSGLMKWAFTNVPYFMALRNTYKWMSLVMLLECIVAAYAVHTITRKNGDSFLKRYISLIMVGLVVLSTGPIWIGKIHEPSAVVPSLPDYWNKAIAYMNKEHASQDDRILLLPNQYFSVYYWNNRQVAFPASLEASVFKAPIVQNTCRGCGQFNTAKLLDFTYANLESNNLSKLMGLVNVTSVLQRNDYDSAYYNVETPEEIQKIVAKQELTLEKRIGQLDVYQLPKGSVYPRIYSPKTLVGTNGLDSSLDMFDQYKTTNKDFAFVVRDKTKKSDYSSQFDSGFYSRVFNSDDISYTNTEAKQSVEALPNATYGVTKSNTASESSFQVSYVYSQNGYRLRFKNIDGTIKLNGQPVVSKSTDSQDVVAFIPYSRNPLILQIEDKSFYISPSDTEQALPSVRLSTKKQVSIASFEVEKGTNLLPNGSFEQGSWNDRVANCSETTAKADIKSSLVQNDKTDGKQSLLLHASNDSACMFSSSINGYEAGGTYLVSFDYKTVRGASPAYCVWDGKGCVIYRSVKPSDSWATENQSISTNSDNKQFILYIYAPKDNYRSTDDLFDNFRVSKVGKPVAKQSILLPDAYSNHSEVKSSSKTLEVNASIVRDPVNLVNNGSFDDGSWNSAVGNCQEASKDAKVTQKIVKDGGRNAIELGAQNALACISSSSIREFNQKDDYILGFDYKPEVGDGALFCIWNGEKCIKKTSLNSAAKDWQHYEIGFTPGTESKSVSVYLYAQSKKTPTRVLYANVSIHRLQNKVLNAYGIKKTSSPELSQLRMDYKRNNATSYDIQIKDFHKGMIVLQESYQPLWTAEIEGVNSNGKKVQQIIAADDHKIVNGYANAWLLDPAKLPEGSRDLANVSVHLRFEPQKYFYTGTIISGTALMVCMVYIVAIFIRGRREA